MMDNDINSSKQVSNQYLLLRDKVLNYTNIDMGLTLDNREQVYIALFDIPMESGIIGFQTQSLALVFGLNTHLYHGSGTYIVGLEKYPGVKKAMQSLLISSHQALSKMKLINDYEFFNSKSVRTYLKTGKGIYFKELKDNDKVDKFLLSLMNYVMTEISRTGELNKK